MIRAQAVTDVRDAEAVAMSRLPDGALMARAAAGLAAELTRLLVASAGGVHGARVVLLVGAGANGGDALLAGARLARRGATVHAVVTTQVWHEPSMAVFQSAGCRVVHTGPDAGSGPAALEQAASVLDRAHLVVDGILGIGGRPGLPSGAARLLDRVRDDVPVVAVDVPSGVDPDTGEVPGNGSFVHADLTVTFGAAKPCLLLPPADAAAGDVVVVDIGLEEPPPAAPTVTRLEPADVPVLWPIPDASDDKYSRGVVGVVAGSATYTGAALLATGAAVRSGAGMVRYLGPPAATDLVRARWPEVVPGEGRVQAWVLGPGVDPDDAAQGDRVRAALAGDEPCLVDAGALTVLVDVLRSGDPVTAPLLLTPHAGELARLLSALGQGGDAPIRREDVEARPLHHARAATDATGGAVLLKGATTVVVTPHGGVCAQPAGPHWLATAGSGDVLAGIAGTLLAAGLTPRLAGGLAVVAHATAGQVAGKGGPVSAGALLDALPEAVAGLLAVPADRHAGGARRSPFARLSP